MSKVITCPVSRWPGTVTLSDPLTYPQVFAFEDALKASREAGEDVRRVYYTLLPGVLACVEEFSLDGFPTNVTRDTFPATPAKSAAELAAWLVKEVSTLFAEAIDVPFQSSEPLMNTPIAVNPTENWRY